MHPLIAEIHENFKIAERTIKSVERLGELGLTFPAVNQLRYVAYHLLRAHTSRNEDFIHDELREALYHTHRAIHDSSEVGIVYLLDLIRRFQEDYRTIAVTDVFPDYLDIIKTANKAKECLTTRVNNSVKENAHNTYDTEEDVHKAAQEAKLYFDLLCRYVNMLNIARVELNKKLKHRRQTAIAGVVTTGLLILGLIISILK